MITAEKARVYPKTQEWWQTTMKQHRRPLLVEYFGWCCERMIFKDVGSSDEIYLQHWGKYRGVDTNLTIKEFDFHIPDMKIVGEVKTSFSPNRARVEAWKQSRSYLPMLGKGYTLLVVLIDLTFEYQYDNKLPYDLQIIPADEALAKCVSAGTIEPDFDFDSIFQEYNQLVCK